MSEKKYKYFISFFHPYGFGSLVVDLEKQIENADEIEAIQLEIVEARAYRTCVITNFILLSKNEGQA